MEPAGPVSVDSCIRPAALGARSNGDTDGDTVGFPLPVLKRRWRCGHCGGEWREEDLVEESEAILPGKNEEAML